MDPSTQNDCSGQTEQFCMSEFPWEDENVPAGQNIGYPEAVAQYLPAGHGMQLVFVMIPSRS